MIAYIAMGVWIVFASEHPTVADIACYPYVSLADERWLDADAQAFGLNWSQNGKSMIYLIIEKNSECCSLYDTDFRSVQLKEIIKKEN
jgi:hypothetical protein